MATTKRRPQKENKIKPDYESPAGNKHTFHPHKENEFTILFKVPTGREGREGTIKLIPFFRHMRMFMGEDGEVDKSKIWDFYDLAEKLWQGENFEAEIMPFALGLNPDDERLDDLGMMDVFMAFIQAVGYIMSGVDDDAYREAEKNLPDEVEPAE